MPESFHAVAHHRGWMDEVGVKLWVEKVWFLLQKRALLVLDPFSAHREGNINKKETLAREMKTTLTVIPGG